MKKLTPKQQAFVDEYIKDFKGGPAYLRAGFKVSSRVAESNASRLLRNADVQAAVTDVIEARSKRTKIDADWVLRRLADISDADLADLYGPDGSMKPVSEWPEVWRKGLVAGVEVFEEFSGQGQERKLIGYTRKVKLADRLKSLELIGKHVDVGAYRERVEHTGKNGAPLPPAVVVYLPDNGRGGRG